MIFCASRIKVLSFFFFRFYFIYFLLDDLRPYLYSKTFLVWSQKFHQYHPNKTSKKLWIMALSCQLFFTCPCAHLSEQPFGYSIFYKSLDWSKRYHNTICKPCNGVYLVESTIAWLSRGEWNAYRN